MTIRCKSQLAIATRAKNSIKLSQTAFALLSSSSSSNHPSSSAHLTTSHHLRWHQDRKRAQPARNGTNRRDLVYPYSRRINSERLGPRSPYVKLQNTSSSGSCRRQHGSKPETKDVDRPYEDQELRFDAFAPEGRPGCTFPLRNCPKQQHILRFKPFGQSSRQARTSLGGSEQADSSTDNKSSKRTSRLLDAFKSTKKPPPSFEVVRKAPNRSTTSFHSSHQPSPAVEVQRPDSRLSTRDTPTIPEPAPRISLSAPRQDPAPLLPAINTTVVNANQDALSPRSPYPPSTTKTRRFSSGLNATTSRRTSDPYLNLGSASNSRAQSPSASPSVEPVNGSFNLHSFRNVRSPAMSQLPMIAAHMLILEYRASFR